MTELGFELSQTPWRRSRAVLGDRTVPFRATLFDKSRSSNWLVTWHQDTALPLVERMEASGWGPWSIKEGVHYAHAPREALEGVLALRVHLDDSTPGNGPLRAIPDTHRQGVLSDSDIQRISFRTAGVECVAPGGGVIAMSPLLISASSKSENALPRRVLHIEYSARNRFTDGLCLASC
jgi:hypothetical protein